MVPHLWPICTAPGSRQSVFGALSHLSLKTTLWSVASIIIIPGLQRKGTIIKCLPWAWVVFEILYVHYLLHSLQPYRNIHFTDRKQAKQSQCA